MTLEQIHKRIPLDSESGRRLKSAKERLNLKDAPGLVEASSPIVGPESSPTWQPLPVYQRVLLGAGILISCGLSIAALKLILH